MRSSRSSSSRVFWSFTAKTSFTVPVAGPARVQPAMLVGIVGAEPSETSVSIATRDAVAEARTVERRLISTFMINRAEEG
jgi:hypothetical protein